MEYFRFKILNNTTINKALSGLGLGLHKINHLINTNKVKKGSIVLRSEEEVFKDDNITIDITEYEKNDYEPTYYDLNILYEDDYFLIVDKPYDVLIYDDKSNNTLANYIRYYYMTNNINRSIRHVHRLDKETTGCILYAKDAITHSALSQMLERNEITRKYHAVVQGKIKTKGVFDNPIGKDRHVKNKMIVYKNGQYATTNYKLLKYDEKNDQSLVEIKLDTGRTHQIRVHFSYNKHPLIGDKIYNPNYNNEKLQLVSYSIELIHPITGKRIYVNV